LNDAFERLKLDQITVEHGDSSTGNGCSLAPCGRSYGGHKALCYVKFMI
jgi:hypothetical protein